MSTQTLETVGLHSSSWAMRRFGYQSRKAFWLFVHNKGVPCVRLTAKNIKFDPNAVEAWIAAHSSNGQGVAA